MTPYTNKYRAALYMRLSRDDGQSESSSISTQRKMLQSYAKTNVFDVYDEYIDDGWSGTNFDRPNFKRMIQDIKDKKVNLVITKDLSRLGRDYIQTGQYTEIFFPTNGVRYIAINDGYDSDSSFTDIAPFKNVINEMYARDTSKKIRSAFLTKMEDGCFIGSFAPYGYQKDPENKNHLIVDYEVAPIVKIIFQLAYNGDKPTNIARYLNEKGIMTPAMYRCNTRPHLDVSKYSTRKRWTASTVSKLLRNVVYLGHLQQGKTTKVSFKSKVTITNQKEDWIVVKHTHEPIIEQEMFDIVGRRSVGRLCSKKGKFENVFSGIAKCKDCGRNMSATGTRKKGSLANLSCGNYKLYGCSECSNHFIDYQVLYGLVVEAIAQQVQLSKEDELELEDELKATRVSKKDTSALKHELDRLEKRNHEVDSMIEKLYEDNFHGILTNERYHKLLKKYETEHTTIIEKIHILHETLKNGDKQIEEASEVYTLFLNLIKQYTDIKILTPVILYKFIERIEISQGSYEKTPLGKVKHQKVQIYFRFFGNPTETLYSI